MHLLGFMFGFMLGPNTSSYCSFEGDRMPRQHQVAALAYRDTYRVHIGMYRISVSGFRIQLGLWLESEGFTKSELGWVWGIVGSGAGLQGVKRRMQVGRLRLMDMGFAESGLGIRVPSVGMERNSNSVPFQEFGFSLKVGICLW